MKSIAFIDNFVVKPVNHSVNDFLIESSVIGTYHMPGMFGMDSLNRLKKADGIILLGSASHVTQDLPWHRQLMDYVLPKLENGIPVLGICFGHQILAHYYGCEVGFIHENEFKYTETRKIKIEYDTLGLKKGEELHLAYSHSQAVKKISADIISVASSKLGPNEAITHRKYPMWGFQAHPEATEKFITEDAKTKDATKLAEVLSDGRKVLNNFIKIL